MMKMNLTNWTGKIVLKHEWKDFQILFYTSWSHQILHPYRELFNEKVMHSVVNIILTQFFLIAPLT